MKAQQALTAAPNDPATQDLVTQPAALSQKAEDIFDGEKRRGLLLTAYGFSLLGDRGATAALACFIIAIVVAIGAAVSLGLGLRINPGRSLERAMAGPSGAVPVAS